jgi:type I restriction enzyme, S subunit
MLNTEFCYQQSQNLTRGIANRDLGLTRMTGIDILLPPIARQREFARRAEQVERLNDSSRASLVTLDSLCLSLQRRAFHGGL